MSRYSTQTEKLIESFDRADGSAVVDFLLVTVPVLFVALSVLGISWAKYTQLVMVDTAIDSARYAALADQAYGDGCVRARQLFSKVFGNGRDLRPQCGVQTIDGRDFSVVTLSTELVSFGLVSFGPEIKVSAKAIRELQR